MKQLGTGAPAERILLGQQAAELTNLIYEVRQKKAAILEQIINLITLQRTLDIDAMDLQRNLSSLHSVDRYEKRALSARKKLFRKLRDDA